ncbi:ATP-dependent RNA helicase DDX50 [Fukomys damarensis]|uniref:ATP-dependent RNA helicase DDX50 n=1 Tax=Fukomys damarensis TaxID=885580 RepID=A0A091E843_FUKDA|nr:ATP-dependent RNA helicase DDX50 [Fukomys damarensis]
MKSKYEQVDLVGKMTQKAAATVEHLAILCDWSQRPVVIGDDLKVYSGSEGRAIIFHETKKNVTEMAMNPHMKQDAQCLHGDTAQSQREITLKFFREAQRLIEENGVVGASAAALAHISGASSFEPCSLISCDKGFVAVTLESPEEIQDVSCAWKELNRKLSSNAGSQITRVCLLKGNMVFALMFPQLSQKGYRQSGMIQTGYSQCQPNHLKSKNIIKATHLIPHRGVAGQVAGLAGQAAQVADQVDRVNKGVTQEVDKVVEGEVAAEIDQEVEATNRVLTEQLIVNLPA